MPDDLTEAELLERLHGPIICPTCTNGVDWLCWEMNSRVIRWQPQESDCYRSIPFPRIWPPEVGEQTEGGKVKKRRSKYSARLKSVFVVKRRQRTILRFLQTPAVCSECFLWFCYTIDLNTHFKLHLEDASRYICVVLFGLLTCRSGSN